MPIELTPQEKDEKMNSNEVLTNKVKDLIARIIILEGK